MQLYLTCLYIRTNVGGGVCWEEAYVGRRRGTLSLATDASYSTWHFTTFYAAFRRFLDLGILRVGI